MARLRYIVALGFVVAGFVSGTTLETASAATVLYGRAEWHGYFANGTGSGRDYSCNNHGQLICEGIHVNNVQSFLEFYLGHLYGPSEQYARASAFTILTMLGVDGPSTGGFANGVQMAKNRFGEWENRVRAYGNAGRINFDTGYTFTTNTAYRRGDILWRNVPAASESSIVFYLPDGGHVAIKRSCANLVSSAYLPQVDYNLSASSSANRSSALPNERITWTHRLNNNGPGATTQTTWSNLGMSGFTNGWGSGLSEATTGANAGVGVIRDGWGYTVYDVTQNDVGNTLCQWVQFDPTNASGGRNGRGNSACVSVPYRYSLTPSINPLPGYTEAGSTVTVTPRVVNNGPTKSRSTTWQISYITIAPGAGIPGGAASGSDPCSFYRPSVLTCAAANFDNGAPTSGNEVFLPPGKTLTPGVATIGDLAVGTQVCYALSVNARSDSPGSTPWMHSTPSCIVIAKRPSVQVTGSDVIIGKGLNSKIVTSINKKNLNGQVKVYGSWGEYAVAASGVVTGMASGAGLSDGRESAVRAGVAEPTCPVSFLTLTNGTTGACSETTLKGGYSVGAQLPNITSRFTQSTNKGANPTIDVATEPSGVYRATGNVTVNASADVSEGRSIVINAPAATVTITGGGIRYANGPYASAAQIPQVVIIADRINIQGSVGRIDAWLLATGTNGIIRTCSDVPVITAAQSTSLNANVCANQLTVNGPVAARKLYLYRTAGSGTGGRSAEAAEVFNLRPDAYLWATNFNANGGRLQTAATEELPPRF